MMQSGYNMFSQLLVCPFLQGHCAPVLMGVVMMPLVTFLTLCHTPAPPPFLVSHPPPNSSYYLSGNSLMAEKHFSVSKQNIVLSEI